LWYPPQADTRGKLECIYRYLFAFLSRVLKHDDFSPIYVRTKGAVKVYGPLPEV
jgi:hypothetical protein